MKSVPLRNVLVEGWADMHSFAGGIVAKALHAPGTVREILGPVATHTNKVARNFIFSTVDTCPFRRWVLEAAGEQPRSTRRSSRRPSVFHLAYVTPPSVECHDV